MTARAALYLRVSTSRQAEKDLSIPDQRRQAKAYCERKGWIVAAEYIEPGASATDDKRPEFQRLIADATSAEGPFDVIVFHSFSRFFRDFFLFELYRRKLQSNGVSIVSITQELGDDPMADMARQVFNMFDEYQSKENSKHVTRAMKENARQGFWNGSQPPYGYRTVEAERRGNTIKKRLEIDAGEAAIVRRIFDLYLHGDGEGAMGIKGIADHLNREGYRNRQGHAFGKGFISNVLARESYVGRHYYNRTSYRTRQPRDRSEWIEVHVPPVVSPEVFERAQNELKRRSPAETPPRQVNNPTLLTGLLKCSKCGGGMTLSTGKGGRYRYYTCANKMRKGRTACEGSTIRMDRLDELVLDHFERQILEPARLGTLLSDLMKRSKRTAASRRSRLAALRRKHRELEKEIKRLYEAIGQGKLELDDLLQEQISGLKERLQEVTRLAEEEDRRTHSPEVQVTPKAIARFAEVMRERLRDPSKKARKAYLRLFIDRIELGADEVQIRGSKAVLAQAAASDTPTWYQVPSFDRKWWARQDSNLRQHRYERRVLTS